MCVRHVCSPDWARRNQMSSAASGSPRSIHSTTAWRGGGSSPTGRTRVRIIFDTRPTKVDNIGRLPMAWVDPAAADTSVVLASGSAALAEYQRALDEWRGLRAAGLTGLVGETMTIAGEFTNTP